MGILLVPLFLSAFVYQPFDDAMDKDARFSSVDDDTMQQYLGASKSELYDFFKQLYEQECIVDQAVQEVRIPKIIHQIWIGKPLPEALQQFQESCKKLHPDWEYRLWTQDDLATLHLHNTAYIKQSRNPGEISDLLRYEILYQYGGVYLDCDIACLTALDELHEQYDFYIGLQPLDTGFVQLGIGVIGACSQHPIIRAALDGIQDTWHNPEYKQMATARTGPLYFTKLFIEQYRSGMGAIALPAFYFYPLGSTQVDIHKEMWRAMGSYTVHHWAKSWLLPSFRRKQFQNL